MKRLTLIGILLVLFAFAVLYISAWQVESGFSSGKIIALSLPSNSVRYAQFNLTNTTIVGTLYYTNSTPITYYLLNSTGFSKASPYLNSSAALYQDSNSLEGNGTIEIIWNSPSGIFPSQPNASIYTSMALNQSPQLPKGSYYNVFDNLGQPNATLYYSIIEKTPGEVSSSIISNAIYGVIGAALFIAGIVALLYSIVIGKEAPKQAARDEEVSRMYASIERKHDAGRRPGKKARRHSGRS